EARTQKRKGDGEAREARHHDENARRDGKHRQQPEQLHDLAARRAAACWKQVVERQRLLRLSGHREGERQDDAEAKELLHSTTSAEMKTRSTAPSERRRARSSRSARR